MKSIPRLEAHVLPFPKRPRAEAEYLSSGEFDVVRTPPLAAPPKSRRPSMFPAPPSDRPRVFQDSVDDDALTCVMPQKPKSSFPPSSRHGSRPRPSADLDADLEARASMFPPSRSAAAPPSQPVPSSLVPPFATSIPREARESATARLAPPQADPFAHAVLSTAAIASETPVALGSREASVPVAPAGTFITTRTRVFTRPTVSWAAALVALGIFVGLLTSVVARGDADSLLEATATFVAPSHARASAPSHGPGAVAVNVGATAPAPVLPAPAPVVNAAIPPTTGSPAAPGEVLVAKPASELASSKPEPKPATRRAAPARHVPPPATDDDAMAAAPAPAPKPAPAAARAAKPTRVVADDDGAARAAELADEQLKAALR